MKTFRINHCFGNMSSNKTKFEPMAKSSVENEGAVFDSLCAINNIGQHRCSKAITLVNLTVGVHREDYESLGFNLIITPKTFILPSMADTGCQSCLAGIKVIYRLGMKKSDLIPVTLSMHAANNKGITILGAIILRFAGKQGNMIETRQITYVTDNSDNLCISREACVCLQMITDTFPTIGDTNGNQTIHTLNDGPHAKDSNGSGLATECDCPRHQKPTSPSTKLPFPANENNRESL